MKTAILYFTKQARELAKRLSYTLEETEIFGKEDFAGDFHGFVGRAFSSYDALVFIMAAGIVVRSIAPYLKSKYTDPAVVVLDEKGGFAVSLLSGHIGGANELAQKIAAVTGGQAVITTASDVNQVVAFDVFAKKNQLGIQNPIVLKTIGSALVQGEKIGFFCEEGIEAIEKPPYLFSEKDVPYQVWVTSEKRIPSAQEVVSLHLVPKNLVLGIGCKKGVSMEAIQQAVEDFLAANGRLISGIALVASIDKKAQEEGILAFCNIHQLPFVTVPTETLLAVEKEFSCSPFVKEHIGVGSVCEACAVYGGGKGELVCGKKIYPGITLALGKINLQVTFNLQ